MRVEGLAADYNSALGLVGEFRPEVVVTTGLQPSHGGVQGEAPGLSDRVEVSTVGRGDVAVAQALGHGDDGRIDRAQGQV